MSSMEVPAKKKKNKIDSFWEDFLPDTLACHNFILESSGFL